VNSIYRPDLFNGKTALITGGGTGIGLRTARELAALGCEVILASRRLEVVEESARRIRSEGGRALGVTCNIREPESVESCVSRCITECGKIDLLVNNGGGQFPQPAESISQKGWKAVVETNLNGTFAMTQAVFNHSMKARGGAIVNVLLNNRNGFPLLSHSAAARAAVENLTKTLAVEWGKYAVRINSVSPGIIASSGLDTYAPEFQEFVRAAKKNNLAYRLGTEGEVASAILYLLSPGAAYITGTNLRVDAGEALYSPLLPPSENHWPQWD
jgi:citronellol/citronellal dehydrogenase